VKRRDFAAALASVVLGLGRLAEAQSRTPHIVFLWLGPAGSGGETLKGFQAGLREFGYEEGRNLIVDYRYTDGSEARLAELAAVVATRPDLISAFGGVVIGAVTKLTRTILIVSLTGDPVGLGFAASLARPGGNVTGMTVQVGLERAGKWLELLTEILPRARRIAMLRRASNPASAAELSWMRAAADRLVNGLTIDEYVVREVSQLRPCSTLSGGTSPSTMTCFSYRRRRRLLSWGCPRSAAAAISRMPVCSSATAPASSTSFAISGAISTAS